MIGTIPLTIVSDGSGSWVLSNATDLEGEPLAPERCPSTITPTPLLSGQTRIRIWYQT
jgi:hypothetical protein